MRTFALAGFVVLSLASQAVAQSKNTDNTLKLDASTNPGKAALADAAWLAGHWTGPGLGGLCEEVWVPPLAGSGEMLGMFRWVREGKTAMTEHCSLATDGESLTLRIRHFDGSFNAREDKDKPTTFRLVRAEKDALYFDGLTFRKTADGGLDAFVAISRAGKVSEAGFRYKPVKPAGK
jgi:hypothetical protein